LILLAMAVLATWVWIRRPVTSHVSGDAGEWLVTMEDGKTVLHNFDIEAGRHRVRTEPLKSGRLMNDREVAVTSIDSVCVICAAGE